MTLPNALLLGFGIYGGLWILARPLATFIETYTHHEAALPTSVFYLTLFGNPLWTYHILPIHNGVTSLLMFFLWGLYGFHVYLFHQNSYIRNASYKSLLIGLFVAIDALVLEYFVNITSVYLFGSYLFYYFPNDLSHLSTAVIAPAYIFMGYCAAVLLKKFELRPILFGSLGLAGGYLLVFVAGGA